MNFNVVSYAQALGLIHNQDIILDVFYHCIGVRYSEVTEQQICLPDLKTC
jgi:hypothetical protein